MQAKNTTYKSYLRRTNICKAGPTYIIRYWEDWADHN